MNLNHLKAFVTTVSGVVSLELLIGIIALALFFWNRFNSWTEKEGKYGKARPPRQFTTWARFVTYATLYTLSVEIVYVLLVTSPHLIGFVGDLLKDPAVAAVARNPTDRTFPLWVLVFLIGFFPHLPVLRQVEEGYRIWFHQRAFIPAEAKALINQLVANPAFFKADERFAQEVVQKYGRVMPAEWGRQKGDNRLRSKWFRLAYLREKIEQWRSGPEIERYFSHCTEEYRLFQEQFKQLVLDVDTYYERAHARDDRAIDPSAAESLERLRLNILREIEKLLARVYEFIACGVLSTERIHSRRIALLHFFGLYPTYEPGMPIVVDIVLKNAVIVFLIATVTSLGYLTYLRFDRGEAFNIAIGLVWAAIALLMIGLCIFSAVVLYRILTRKSRFEGDANSDAVVVGPFVHQCIGFITGYACGLLVTFPYFTVGSQAGWSVNLARAMPWPLIPAITASFVVFYLAALSARRRPLSDALIQGAITGGVGLLACAWAFGDLSARFASIAYIGITCAAIGAAIGYFFPQAYRERVAALYRGPERRQNPRISLAAQSALEDRGQRTGCEILNLSLDGAYLNALCNSGVGARVEIDLPGVGRVDSQVVRSGRAGTAVRFRPDDRKETTLRRYIGDMAWSAG